MLFCFSFPLWRIWIYLYRYLRLISFEIKIQFNSIALNQEGVNNSESEIVSIVFIATVFLDSWIYHFFCLALKCSAFPCTYFGCQGCVRATCSYTRILKCILAGSIKKRTTLPSLKYPVKLHVGSTVQHRSHRDERLLNRQRTLKWIVWKTTFCFNSVKRKTWEEKLRQLKANVKVSSHLQHHLRADLASPCS